MNASDDDVDVLIVGAGGGFKQMLVDTGVGNVIGQMAVQAQISPILLAWLVAAVIRIATGSATVATIGAITQASAPVRSAARAIASS